MSQDNSKETVLKLKAQKEHPEFTDLADALEMEELKNHLARLAKYREETELAKSKDEELERAKELVKVLNEPYAETIKALKLKMAYLNILMTERGEAQESDENA